MGIRCLEPQNDHLNLTDLLLREQQEALLKLNLGALCGVDEIWGDVATIELHALDEFQFIVQGLSIFDCDHSFVADLVN